MSKKTTAKAPSWKGATALRRMLVPVGSLKRHPKNPRRGDLPAIASSIDRFGQLRAVIVQKSSGYIVAGNHTHRAIEEVLGWPKVARMEVDLSDDEAEAFLIADNRTSDLAEYENEVLLPILSEMEERGSLEGTGWSVDELEDFRSDLGRVAEAERRATEAAHSETDQEIADRQALRGAGKTMREVVLMFDEDRYGRFGNYVRMLQKESGKNGVTETVYDVIERAAKAL